MHLPRRSFALALTALVLLPLAAACSSRPRADGGVAPERGRPATTRVRPLDPIPLYANAGLLALAAPVRFVGSVRYLAGPSPDTTLLLLSLSLPNNTLTFANAPDGQLARYVVSVELKRDGVTARRTETRQSVRVGSFRETSRTDESVLFQQFLRVLPGQYDLTLAVRDDGSSRTGQQSARIAVPRLTAGALSTPIAVYETGARSSSDSLPDLVANPRATAFFGRDSLVHVYLEGYGLPARTEAELAVIGDREEVLWSDSVAVGDSGHSLHGATAEIPVAEIGIGQLSLVARVGGTTMRAPLFVTFGDEWAITSMDEMLNYLRFYLSPARLSELRAGSPQARARTWSAFYRSSDPDPRTPEHEALRDYFGRVQFANERFTEEGEPGWLTDRGEVYVTLGDPDQVLDQGTASVSARGRTQVWTYAEHRLQLVFVDQTGFGRWRLIPTSQGEFNSVAMRERK